MITTVKHVFFLMFALLNMAGLSSLAGTRAESKPNFLFIAIDDMNDHFGFLSQETGNNFNQLYPDPLIRKQVLARLSPSIDRFAGEAVTFTRAYTAAPVCNPSRVSLMFGAHPFNTGIYANNAYQRSLPTSKNRVSIAQLLKNGGYYTAGLGKIFHSPRPKNGFDFPDERYSWSKWINRPVGASGKLIDTGAPRLKFIGQLENTTEKTADWQNAKFIADVISNRSATITDYENKKQQLTLPKDKPFFLALGIFRPHIPWYLPKEYYEEFPLHEIGVTEDTIEHMYHDMQDLPEAGVKKSGLDHGIIKELFKQAIAGKYPGGKLSAYKRMIQAYIASVAYVDDCLDLVFNALDKSGYADNTIVVLWSDHGWHTSSKYTFDKLTLWEPSTKSLLMIRDPRIKPGGKKSKRVVSLLDIYPTIAKMAGVTPTTEVDGRDISQLLSNPDMPWPESAVSTFHKGNHTLRTRDWRLIRYADGSKEMYHMVQDPYELINLSGKPAFAEQEKNLEAQLNKILSGG